nr:hypothetical protein CFP56_30722 [Quercus suber]
MEVVYEGAWIIRTDDAMIACMYDGVPWMDSAVIRECCDSNQAVTRSCRILCHLEPSRNSRSASSSFALHIKHTSRSTRRRLRTVLAAAAMSGSGDETSNKRSLSPQPEGVEHQGRQRSRAACAPCRQRKASLRPSGARHGTRH